MIDPTIPTGKLYTCQLTSGETRVCRYGFHRKNNINNWSDPGETCVALSWIGWRDDVNGRFIRPEEIISWKP